MILSLQQACAQQTRIPDTVASTLPEHYDPFSYVSFIPGNFNAAEVDALGNIYLLTNTYSLRKLNPQGDSIAVYNDVRRYGNPTYLDVSNPLKTLLYYRNYSTVVELDRLLSLRNTVNLRAKNIFRVNAATTSYDNNIWIFDEQDMKLKKISPEGNTVFESNDIRQLPYAVPSPVYIADVENAVYLYDPKTGFTVFDQYGTVKQQLPFLNWKDPRIINGFLTGFSNGQLHTYRVGTLEEKIYAMPKTLSGIKSIRINNGRIYALKEDGLHIYDTR